MFKKKFKVNGQNQLSGKDKKLLKNLLAKIVHPDAVNHFIEKSDKVLAQKMQGSKALIYVECDNPMLVDLTGAGDLVPTLYFLLSYPGSVPHVLLNQGVEEHVFNGANLMWPGVRTDSLPDDCPKDSIVAVMSLKREYVAIGKLAAARNKDSKRQGIAIEIVNFLNDAMWAHGDGDIPPVRLHFQVKEKEDKRQKKEQKQESKVKKETKKQEEQQPKGKKQNKKEEQKNRKEAKKETKKPKQEQSDQQEDRKPKKGKKKKQQSQQQEDRRPKKGKKAKQDQQQDEGRKPKKGNKAKEEEDNSQEEGRKPKKGKKAKEEEDNSQEESRKPKKGKKAKDLQEDQPKNKKGKQEQGDVPDKQKKKQPKGQQQSKPRGKPKQESSSSDEEVDLSKAFGVKKINQEQPQDIKPVVAAKQEYSDQQEDRRGRKKKLPKRKQQESDEQTREKKAKNKKGNKKQNDKKKEDEADREEDDTKKGGRKGKKQESDQQQKNRKKGNKVKKGRVEESQSDQDEEGEKQAGQTVEQREQKEEQPKNEKYNDQLLREAFLNALKIGGIEKKLPIDGGQFLSDFILKARRPGVMIDLKNTTYKKISKFYQVVDKEGIITIANVKDKKSGNQAMQITKVHWDNQQLQGWNPTVEHLQEKEEEEEDFSGMQEKEIFEEKVQIEKQYRPNGTYYDILLYPDDQELSAEELAKQKNKIYFSLQELETRVVKFFTKLSVPQEKNVYRVDLRTSQLLNTLLAQKQQSKEEAEEKKEDEAEEQKEVKKRKNIKNAEAAKASRFMVSVTAHEAALKLADCMMQHHCVRKAGIQRTKKGQLVPIEITMEKVHNRNVTKITGLETFIKVKEMKKEEDERVRERKEKETLKEMDKEVAKKIKFLAGKWQIQFACSVNIHDLGFGRWQILLHGSFAEIDDYLAKWKVPREYIKVVNKIDKKKK